MQDHFEESYMGKLWYIVLGEDKRSFNEYFSEEHGITLNDDITDYQLSFLVINVLCGQWAIEDEQSNRFKIMDKLKEIRDLNLEFGVYFQIPIIGF
tara:strand:+ start:287 stop:574 length:288 start_codon:yes stop_codon:yes gene_type:complete